MQKAAPENWESNSGDKILILTPFGKKALKLLLSSLSILIIVAIIILNWPLLLENPFATKLKWNVPILSYRNVHGDMAVVDNDGKRIVVLNSEGEIRSIIRANPFSRRAISFVQDVAIDDKYIYILDLQHSSNGAQINGEKVLVYDLDGKYVATPYQISHPESTQRENVFCTISCHNGKVFVSKRMTGKVIIYQLVDNNFQPYQALDFPGKNIFSSNFMPDTRSTYVVTRDACHYLNYQNNLEELPATDSETYWSDVCIAPSGERYYLDANKHEIIQLRPNIKKKQLIQLTSRNEIRKIPDVYTLRISLQDDILNWCCSIRNEVITFDVSSWKKTVSTQVPQPIKMLLIRGLVWLLAFLLLIYLIKNIVVFTWDVAKCLRRRQGEEDLYSETAKETLTVWNLYGKNTFTLLFAFLAVTAVITTFYMNHAWEIMASSARAKAAGLKSLPPNVFGDYLEKINSPKDYNSKAFDMFYQVASSSCYSEEGDAFDVGFSAIRKLSNGKYMCVISPLYRYNIGKIVDKKDPDFSSLYSKLLNLKPDVIQANEYSRGSGNSNYFVFTKIMNSNGEEVGVISVSCSKDKVYSETFGMVAKLSIDLLLLFIIFVFLSGELKLGWDFRKLKKQDPSTGLLTQTVCEGHRTIQFLATASLYLDIAFLPTLTVELARQTGISGSMNLLAAIPLSARSLMLVLALIFGGFLVKHNPRNFLKLSALLTILCFLAQINAVYSGKYYLFLFATAAIGIMQGMKSAVLDAISATPLKPDEKFKNFVYVNTECLIGAVVGTSLGSLLCAKIGYVSVFIFGILIEILMFFVAGEFLADDLNQKKWNSIFHNTKNTIWHDWARLKITFKHIMRPDLLALLLCIMIPMSILGQFDSYILPLYNAWAGYPQLLTGFTGAVTKVLALILIPYTFNKLANRGNRIPLLAGMFILIVGLVFFGLDSTLPIMAILLLIITIFNIIFITSADRLRLAMAQEDHIKFTDAVGFFHAFQSIGSTVAPLLLGLGLKMGVRTFIFIFAGAMFVLMIVFIIFSRHMRRSVVGRCL